MACTPDDADHMATIAVLGTGLLGAGMVENLLTKGETVRIWNRTREKLAPLVERGAVAAEDPADCVRGAERVHLILSEDSAVDSVIEQLRPGLADGVPIIDHTTNRPDKVRARFDALRAANVRYVPTPVFMAPKHAQEGSGMMMMSGPKQDADDLTAALETMTGKLWHVGDRPDLASVLKLAGNSVYFAITGHPQVPVAASFGSVFAPRSEPQACHPPHKKPCSPHSANCPSRATWWPV